MSERKYSVYFDHPKAGNDVLPAMTFAGGLAEAKRLLKAGAIWVEVRNLDGDILLNAKSLKAFTRARISPEVIIQEARRS